MTRDELLKAYAEGRRDFRGMDFSTADLREADLRYTNLRHTILRHTNLSRADLRGAILRRADLRYTDLSYTDLRWTDLSCAILPEELTIIYGEKYPIQIFKDNVRAGCQCHSASEWLAMTGDQLYEMDEENAIAYYPRLIELIKFYCKDYL